MKFGLFASHWAFSSASCCNLASVSLRAIKESRVFGGGVRFDAAQAGRDADRDAEQKQIRVSTIVPPRLADWETNLQFVTCPGG